MKEFRKIFPDMVAIMLFALIAFVYFFPAVTEDRILAQHDAVAGIGAGREMQEYREATGERTRWTNAIFGGMPTYQMSPSYDSSDTLNVVQKIYRLFLPDYVWYVFIMLLGFYILLRAFNFKVWMATLGAVIWSFSSYFFIIIAAGHILEICDVGIHPTYDCRYGIGVSWEIFVGCCSNCFVRGIANYVESSSNELLFSFRHAVYGYGIRRFGLEGKANASFLLEGKCGIGGFPGRCVHQSF